MRRRDDVSRGIDLITVLYPGRQGWIYGTSVPQGAGTFREKSLNVEPDCIFFSVCVCACVRVCVRVCAQECGGLGPLALGMAVL